MSTRKCTCGYNHANTIPAGAISVSFTQLLLSVAVLIGSITLSYGTLLKEVRGNTQDIEILRGRIDKVQENYVTKQDLAKEVENLKGHVDTKFDGLKLYFDSVSTRIEETIKTVLNSTSAPRSGRP